MKRKKIAIIGTGISGLACARFLHPNHDLEIFEQDSRIGGHSHTISVDEEGHQVVMDTGFMVYNEVTYPLLTRLFAELQVTTKLASMSFSVRHEGAGIEFNGSSVNLLFGQRRNLLRPRFWKMLFQIDRFNREAFEEVERPCHPGLTLEAYAAARGYGEDFLEWYLIPMAAAVWSSPPDRVRAFPATTLMRFWYNHGFLGLHTQHPWRTVDGGSRRYVEVLASPFRDRIRTGDPALKVTQDRRVITASGDAGQFDQVIIAIHGDQALRLLEAPTILENRLLGTFHYQPNEAVIHTDESVMPRARRCWASWNYRVHQQQHSTHYWMNNLQGLSCGKNYFVSINPVGVNPAKVVRTLSYEHPLFDLEAVQAQEHLPLLHAEGDTTGRYFCGAWQRYGFHEDGLWSASRLCEHLLGKDPWS